MNEPRDAKRTVELNQPCGCATASSVEGWKAQDTEEQALARSRLGRLVLRMRRWVARATR